MVHYIIHIVCLIVIGALFSCLVAIEEQNKKNFKEYTRKLESLSKLYEEHNRNALDQLTIQYEQIIKAKDTEIEKLKKQATNTYDQRDPTIVRINNVYPIKIEGTVWFTGYELDDLKPELKEQIMLDRLVQNMSEQIKPHISYKISDQSPIDHRLCVLGRLEIIPKHDYISRYDY